MTTDSLGPFIFLECYTSSEIGIGRPLTFCLGSLETQTKCPRNAFLTPFRATVRHMHYCQRPRASIQQRSLSTVSAVSPPVPGLTFSASPTNIQLSTPGGLRAVGAQHPYLVSAHDTARTPKLLARGPRIPNARTDALADQIALKLGNGRDHTRTDE